MPITDYFPNERWLRIFKTAHNYAAVHIFQSRNGFIVTMLISKGKSIHPNNHTVVVFKPLLYTLSRKRKFPFYANLYNSYTDLRTSSRRWTLCWPLMLNIFWETFWHKFNGQCVFYYSLKFPGCLSVIFLCQSVMFLWILCTFYFLYFKHFLKYI